MFIVDKSAWLSVHRHADLQGEWASALREGQLATCPIVNLEILFSARNLDEFDGWEEDLGVLRMVPVTHAVCLAAIGALRELIARSQRGIPIADALIAAAAQDAGCGVLHYDKHYDLLREVLEFESRWIAPRGSIP